MKKSFRSILLGLVFYGGVFALHAQCLRTVNVSSSSGLSSALSSAQAGDCIVLADGTYSGFTISHSGTVANPITIKAANQGNATISGTGIIHLQKVSNVVLSGLNIRVSGTSQTVDGESYSPGVWIEVGTNCQVTRCTVDLQGQSGATQWILLSGASWSNRVDHCDFGPNTVHGSHMVWPRGNRTIPGVTPPSDRTQWALGNGPYNPNMARHTLIDHNYFHGQASGSAETIVTGAFGTTGDYQDTFTTIEYNLFQDCDGDPEIVSVKSSSNIVRYNTVRSSAGVFSLRSGNSSQIYGNFFICGGSGGGVKVNERHHKVYNNYVENSDGSNYPIMVEDGDPYSSSTFAHAQVVDAEIVHNTVVNAGRQVDMGHGGGTLPPSQCVFANNIISGSVTLYSESSGADVTRSQNIVNGPNPNKSGFLIEDPQFTTVNGLQKLSSGSPAIGGADLSFYSFVTDDMDGQPRSTPKDIGADEFSSASIVRTALTTADVGPNAPDTADFSVSVSPSSRSVNVGDGTTYTVTVSAIGGFSGTVTPSVSGVPAGASGSFSPATITGSGTFTLTVTTSGSTPANTSTLTITGASGSLSHSATATLGVADFNLSISPASRTVVAGNSTNYTVNVGNVNGFSGSVSLSAGGLAAGVGASFSPGSVTPPGSSTLTLTTSGSTPTGADAFTVTGADGGLAHSAGATLNVITNAGTGGPLTFEAENLSFTTNGATAALQVDTNASNGQWMLLNGDSAGDYIQFTLPGIAAGTYSLTMNYKKNNNRAIVTLTVDGAQVGSTVDQYASPSVYTQTTFGNVTLAAGSHLVRLTATSKNASSSSFTISADKFTLVTTSAPPPTVTMEAESMPVTSSGATTSTASDTGASGGVWLALNATNAGPFMDLTTVTLPAGTYQVQLTYKSNTTRGQHTVLVDGVQVGGTVDQYAATQTFPTATIGNVTFSAAGTHTIRMTVTGKNSSSSNYILSADKFTFVGQ